MSPTDRLLDTFLEAVTIDSPSGEEAAFAAWCADRLAACGCAVRYDDSRALTGSECGNLIAELPGGASGPTVVLSAHLDTVEPGRGIRPVVRDGVVRSAGDTILGADDKCGVAAILEVVRRLSESEAPHVPVRVLLTTGEELGLEGAKALDAADCSGDIALVLDADGPVGGIVTAAPTHHVFKATFTGRAAHAGVEPEKGLSAITMAAAAVGSMRLGRLDAQTTANVGEIRGGRATNIVPGECVVVGECRSIDPRIAEAVRLEMDGALRRAAAADGGEVTIRWTKQYDGFTVPDDSPALKGLQEAFAEVGIASHSFATGGGSDGNVLASKGLPALVLSCGMSGVHGTEEHIAVADLHAMADVLCAFIGRCAR